MEFQVLRQGPSSSSTILRQKSVGKRYLSWDDSGSVPAVAIIEWDVSSLLGPNTLVINYKGRESGLSRTHVPFCCRMLYSYRWPGEGILEMTEHYTDENMYHYFYITVSSTQIPPPFCTIRLDISLPFLATLETLGIYTFFFLHFPLFQSSANSLEGLLWK